MHGEEESLAKDSPRTTAEEMLESKKYIKQNLHHHILFGRVSRGEKIKKRKHIQKQTPELASMVR